MKFLASKAFSILLIMSMQLVGICNAERLVLAEPGALTSKVTLYDSSSSVFQSTMVTEGTVLSLEATSPENVLALIRQSGKTFIRAIDLFSAKQRLVVDPSFLPIGMGASDDGLIVLASIQSLSVPAFATFDRYGSFQRVLLKDQKTVFSPHISPLSMQLLFLSFAANGPELWISPFAEPKERKAIRCEGCIDARFETENAVIVLRRESRGERTSVYEIRRMEIVKPSLKVLWKGQAAKAPTLSRNGSSAVVVGRDGDSVALKSQSSGSLLVARQVSFETGAVVNLPEVFAAEKSVVSFLP